MSISDGKLGMTTDGKRIFTTIELMRVALLQFNQEHYLFCLKSVCQGINSSLNFSSIYIEDFDFLEYGYGYPNAKPRLNNGEPNPLHPFKNDGYLFIINKDYTEIEVLILVDGRNLISHYYQHLIDGFFDTEIQRLRLEAKPFYAYIGLDSANSKL